jgi:hypothetical protein
LLARSRILPSKTPTRGLQFFAVFRATVLLPFALCGCSVGGAPLSPDVDMRATGAIPTPAAPARPALPAALDEEDRRRAMGALGIALDPQGNGASVAWNNPVSKAHGTMTPVGYAYPENGLICRKFSAHIESAAGLETDSGAACRDKDAMWTLTDFRKGG